MLYGKYSFTVTFDSDAILPPYKGSTFRGVFGHALKRVTCALKRQTCDDCMLHSKCVYPFVFETVPHEKADRRIAAPPHPYVIEVADSEKTLYRQGDSLAFTLKLFGRANEFLPYFIYALEHIGTLGIGRAREGKRGTFMLDSVVCGERMIYSAHEKKLLDVQPAGELILQSASPCDTGYDRIGIRLITPLRLKYHNSLEGDLPFHVLIRAALRRVSSLMQYHGGGEPELDYRGLVKRACDVTVRHSNLRWYDWRRYSNRQESEMLMGGLIGDILYEGRIGEFLPLLRFCEEVNLGKQTSFGLGKFRLSSIE
ncbi:MAG TPA: CRISPR system precrRNA processing endoribonuclease RAMP protein Cas6 [Syntrophales bacterium]|nr:CRISPR system precrRNA processing endoribonuclease RAMP protein Cas6 [Syntrophales bacterium]